jgi:hypothetical protein
VLMQNIIEWFRVNPPALTALATLLGGSMAAAVAVLTAYLSHVFTARREAEKALTDERREVQKAARDAEATRRTHMRAYLERIVTLVLQHTESEDRLSKSMVLQMVVALHDEKPDPKAIVKGETSVQPLDEARALASLYFPELLPPLDHVRHATRAFVEFRAREVDTWRKDRMTWFVALQASGAGRGQAALEKLLAAQSMVITDARALMVSGLLPGDGPRAS